MMFGKTFIKGSTKARWLYTIATLLITVGSSIGTDMFQMKHDEWNSYWIMQKVGWWLVKLCGCLAAGFLTMKASTSSSTRSDSATP